MLRHRLSLLIVFGAFLLSAVALGAYICALSSVPNALWMRNLFAWGIGALAAIVVALSYRPIMLPIALWGAPLALLATFLSPAQEGVHRWLDVGPLHMNAAMLVLPSAAVALAANASVRPSIWLAQLAALIVLVMQPDASQATVWAAILIVVAAIGSASPLLRTCVIVSAAALGAIAWFRPDPLQPVPEVEGVIGLAYVHSPLLALAALATLILTAMSADLIFRYYRQASRTAALALSLCFLGWVGANFVGAYPMPWVGIGLSPIIGAWLGVGLLVGVRGRGSHTESAS